MNWCDPCAANPLSAEELRGLGVFWQDSLGGPQRGRSMSMAQNVFLTRLHVRYDAAHFPEDLRFQKTSDRSNFQARYILRIPGPTRASARPRRPIGSTCANATNGKHKRWRR